MRRRKEVSMSGVIAIIAAIIMSVSLTGCGKNEKLQSDGKVEIKTEEKTLMKPANEMHFSLAQIEELTISYDEETITFLENEGDELVIKEYMTKDNPKYYGKVEQGRDSIKISEGKKPLFKSGFLRYVEVLLPADYEKKLTLTSTDGTIDLAEEKLELSDVRIDTASGDILINEMTASELFLSTTSGNVEIERLSAKNIRLETTSGNIVCEEMEGKVTYVSTSGNLTIQSASGFGSYQAENSGILSVAYQNVTGDLSFYNKNDTVTLTLPKKLEFNFYGVTKNGSIEADFLQGVSSKQKEIKERIGENPMVTVKTETKNGKIEVEQ